MDKLHHKKTIQKKVEMKKIKHFRSTINSISSNLLYSNNNTNNELYLNDYMDIDTDIDDITKLFDQSNCNYFWNNYDKLYNFWSEKPEIDDPIYGFDRDCESPHLFLSIYKNGYLYEFYKLWGYFKEREIRHRCSMYCYMKAQRRCARPQFWEIFDLEDNFLVELQILAVHLWVIKTRMNKFKAPICNKLCYETFRIMFNEFGVRFEKYISGSRQRWECDCQHACLYLANALDQVWDDTNNNNNNPYIFAQVIWTEIYLFNENISYDVLYLWSKYIFDQIIRLKQINDFDFLNGYWKFGDLPTIKDRQQTKIDISMDYLLENELKPLYK